MSMENDNPGEKPLISGEIAIRVRYAETDRMGLLHHANYLVYFEQGRTELLRSQGLAYKDLEDQGYLLVLTRVQVRYKPPGPVRRPAHLAHHRRTYHTGKDRAPLRIAAQCGTLLAEGETTLGCIDRDGKVQALPSILRGSESDAQAQG